MLLIIYFFDLVNKLSHGSSLEANIALVCNNARVGAQIAAAYASLTKKHFYLPNIQIKNSSSNCTIEGHDVIVVGGLVVDHVVSPAQASGLPTVPLIMKTSNPGTASQTYGGVGRNVAESIVKNDVATKGTAASVLMVSAVGNDAYGDSLIRHIEQLGICSTGIVRVAESNTRTATYTAVHDHTGDLLVAVSDMDVFKHISPAVLSTHVEPVLSKSRSGKACKMVFADGNISTDAFSTLAKFCNEQNIPLFFEPTSVHKCTVPVKAKSLNKVTVSILR